MATLGRGLPYPLENFKAGCKVWLRDPDHVWIKAQLQHDLTFSSTTLRLLHLEGARAGEEMEQKIDPDRLPFLANPDILIGKDDLTALSYLHEPAVLHNLRFRFEDQEKIYTYCGIVLVAINPYADCPHFYNGDLMSIYGSAGSQCRSDLDPHIYAIASEAYYHMREFEQNQSVIVSGESGAGKTVSAKHVMRFLANVAASPGTASQPTTSIEARVLASNPIMESIGNAKTTRNDNSSRFGKFIQINFAEKFSINGAEVKTYLLEKSRVVFQAKHERNYHVFYEMCASHNHPLLADLSLQPAEEYNYTNQGEDLVIGGVDDRRNFEAFVGALNVLNIDVPRQREILRILAGVLKLGNITFEETNDSSVVRSSCLATINDLCSERIFALDASALKLWLVQREIKAVGDSIRKPLTAREAATNRDALSKLIYACLFDWIVNKINDQLADQHEQTRRRDKTPKFIGVLDIYGFETFDINSFEQFCINYANEKLQQQFNQHVFKLEQIEYEREEITWVRIEFYDNQPCIDLIEARPGVIDYLDEQCKTGRGSDASWLTQMANCASLKKSTHLQMPKFKDSSFIIKHFAADVSYRVDGFLNKNLDTVNEQLLAVVGRSQFAFLREVISEKLASSSTGAKRKKTVAFQFRDSLGQLIAVLSKTRPHYVRCIKPNDEKSRFYFEPKRAIQQLRACGVLETVRISAAGFPSRWAYDEFGRRYQVLYPEGGDMWKKNPKNFAKFACQKWLEPGQFELGKTKMFFRVGQVAKLEKCRNDVLAGAAIRIQCAWRRFTARRRYLQIQRSVLLLQAATRGMLARRRFEIMRKERLAIRLQAVIRGYLARRRYESMRRAVVGLQALARGRRARLAFMRLRFEKAALTIQRFFRGYLVRRDRIRYVRSIVKAQSCVRRFLAIRELKRLKEQRTTVLFWENKHQSLEKKVIDLQLRMDVVAGERNQVTAKLDAFVAETEKIKKERDNLASQLAAQISAMRDLTEKVEDRDDQISLLKRTLDDSEQAKEAFKAKLDKIESDELPLLRTQLHHASDRAAQASSQLAVERERCKKLEAQRTELQAQLVANADLMLSSTASKPAELSGTNDVETAIIAQQEAVIADMRLRIRAAERLIEDLQSANAIQVLKEQSRQPASKDAYDTIRMQDLEMSNAKLRNMMEAGAKKPNDESLREENENLREECLELRARLSDLYDRSTTGRNGATAAGDDSSYHSLANSDDGRRTPSGSDLVEEHLQLMRVNRKLTTEVELMNITLEAKNREISEFDEHRKRPPRTSLTNDTSSSVHQIGESAATSSNNNNNNAVYYENALLQQQLNRQADELADMRAQLRGYGRRDTSSSSPSSSADADDIPSRLPSTKQRHLEPHTGCLRVFNVPEFIRMAIYELKPRLARQLEPCLPSHLFFAAFRYYDQKHDDIAITSMFTHTNAILKQMAKEAHDADVLCMWLANCWRLLNLLRQFSGDGEVAWHEQNTQKQDSQRIVNFNLEAIRHQLCLRTVAFYEGFMRNAVEPLLTPKVVPGILQHNPAMMPVHTGLTRQPSKDVVPRGLDDLVELLSSISARLLQFGADRVLYHQCFAQIAKWISAQALNNLMFRKDLCKFERAVLIKHNVSDVQTWFKKHELGELRDTFEPIVQACHLLQSRKDEANIETLCGEMTCLLTSKQVVAILQHYTPSDGFEEDALSPSFIDKVGARLRSRDQELNVEGESKLIVPGSFLESFDCSPFAYSPFDPETLELPPCLDLDNVCSLV